MKLSQLALFNRPQDKKRREHGGDVRKGKRKLARPIDTKAPAHLVLRATKAKGKWSFLHPENKGRVHLLILDTAERYGVKIYRFENVGNHLHMIVHGKNRNLFRRFLRVLPQRIMFAVTGACKGNPVGRFFDGIAYSRVMTWGREFEIVTTYLWKNAMEALGLGRPSEFIPLWSP